MTVPPPHTPAGVAEATAEPPITVQVNGREVTVRRSLLDRPGEPVAATVTVTVRLSLEDVTAVLVAANPTYAEGLPSDDHVRAIVADAVLNNGCLTIEEWRADPLADLGVFAGEESEEDVRACRARAAEVFAGAVTAIPEPSGVTDAQLTVLFRQTQWALDEAAHDFPAGRVTEQRREELAASLDALALIVRASTTETPDGHRLSAPRFPAPGGRPEPTTATGVTHRPWCAPDCPGGVERAHVSRAWSLTPVDEPTSRVALRLVQEPAEDSPGAVAVLLSVIEGGPADITSSTGLRAEEAGLVFEQLVTFARCASVTTRGRQSGT